MNGNTARPVEVEYVRDLTPADIALLSQSRGSSPPAIKQIRERHHSLARCIATGMKQEEAAAVSGYCISRVSILMQDPMFKDLVSFYAGNAASQTADFQERATQVAITALDVVAERLEDSPEDISTGQALEIAKVLGDRTGHAPVMKAQSTNINVDLSARMAAASRRVKSLLPADVLDGVARVVT